ncbi:MAG: DUF2079 domain-containing protein [Deltaproteobacteria bacterium]|nr:DUF2079 domain-containing protein [Deltaproteobacteria bacterium]
MNSNQRPPNLTIAMRALAVLALVGLCVGFALANLLWIPKLDRYYAENLISVRGRAFLLNWMLRTSVVSASAGALWLLWKRKSPDAPQLLHDLACRYAPLACVGLIPVVFRWRVWDPRPLPFLFVVLGACLAVWGSFRMAVRTPAPPMELQVRAWCSARADRLRSRFPRALPYLPLMIVAAAALGYTAYFSYYTIEFHHSVRSGFDLGIKNNIFWNTLHGAPFKASVTLGPNGYSHFARHADVLVFFLLPIYALFQRAETLLVLQSLFLGGAAIPLYWLARRHVRPWPSALIALSYLLHPGIHCANIFEFHFIPLGLPLLWTAWAAMERRKYVLGAIFAALTLFTREDVSMWVVFLGVYLVLSGEGPKAGLLTAALGSVYFLMIKFWIMPMFSGEQSFASNYVGLFPQDDQEFSGALKTLIGNPTFTLSTMLNEAKLIYVLQLFLPLAFIPMRRPIWVLLAVPGFLITLLPPLERAAFSIHYQYTPHWLAFMYPALALGLEKLEAQQPSSRRPILPALAAMVCCTVAVSYQFGSLLQRNTAISGPGRYTFGMDEVGRQRQEAIADIQTVLPPDAKVACSALATPQFSSRADDYDMNQGLFDAEYLVFPTDPNAFIVNEKRDVEVRLESGAFGVVKVHPPFALAKQGHSTALNEETLRMIRGQ